MAARYLKESLAIKLFRTDAVKYNPLLNTIKCNFRDIVLDNYLLKITTQLLQENLREAQHFNLVHGVSDSSLPIATSLSFSAKVPLLMSRSFSLRGITNSEVSEGDRCLLVSDVLLSGNNIAKAAKKLQEAGLICEDVAVVVDMEAGGTQVLEDNYLKVHRVLTMTQMLNYLSSTHFLLLNRTPDLERDPVDEHTPAFSQS